MNQISNQIKVRREKRFEAQANCKHKPVEGICIFCGKFD